MQRFETEHYSLAERGKGRCGDHVVVRVADPYVVLAVSDGVGSRPCDWLASQTTCNELVEHFVSGNTSMPERLRHSVESAHRIVQSQSGDCTGMLATLVVAVWKTGDDHAHIVSVGDSRIYLASATAIAQVSTDDSSAEVYKRFGKPHIVAGAAVTFPVITKAIGQLQPLSIEVEEIPFAPGESIILATDGMYHASSFEARLLTAVRTSSLADGISHLFRLCADEFADDATIAIVRRNDVPERETYRRVIESSGDYQLHQMFGHVTCSTLVGMLHETLVQNDLEKSLSYIRYAEKYDLRLSKSDLIRLLDTIVLHPHRNQPTGDMLFNRVRQMIKRLP